MRVELRSRLNNAFQPFSLSFSCTRRSYTVPVRLCSLFSTTRSLLFSMSILSFYHDDSGKVLLGGPRIWRSVHYIFRQHIRFVPCSSRWTTAMSSSICSTLPYIVSLQFPQMLNTSRIWTGYTVRDSAHKLKSDLNAILAMTNVGIFFLFNLSYWTFVIVIVHIHIASL